MPKLVIRHGLTDKCSKGRNLALLLMSTHGLSDWEFCFNDSVGRAGVCNYPYLGMPGRIELSVHFVERNSLDTVRDTVLHEIAHALVGHGHGHNAVWKAKCREIGARPEATFGEEVDMPQGDWKAQCNNCSRCYYRHRKPRQLVGWHCRHCGRVDGALTWAKSV